jgi:hypothetical protein
MEASTTYSLPRYLLIVFAFAGDSTITSDFAIRSLLVPLHLKNAASESGCPIGF